MATEIITIQGRADMTEIEEQLKIISVQFSELSKVMGKANFQKLTTGLNIAGLGVNQFSNYLKKNFMALTDTGKVMNKITKQTMTIGNAVNTAAIKTRRFKFEWLSIMFAGMALNRAFGGLIRTQLELWGVTEGFSSMWAVVMLPVMELITPLLWKLIDAFMNLPRPVQLAIGIAILFLAVLGKFMLVGGQIMLFLGGLGILLKGSFAAGIVGAGGFLTALAPIAIAIGALILIIIAIWLAWETNFMNIRENIQNFIEGFKQFFGGLISVIKGILNIIKGLFTGDFELIKEGIIQIFKGLWDMLLGGFKALINGIVILFKSGIKLIYNLIRVIVDAVIWITSKIKKFFGGEEIEWKMPAFQTGGLVTQTGPAFLHAGERIIPKGRRGYGEIMFSPTVYVNANISSEMDIRVLASKLNEFWARDFERIAQRRGI